MKGNEADKKNASQISRLVIKNGFHVIFDERLSHGRRTTKYTTSLHVSITGIDTHIASVQAVQLNL